MTSIPVIIHEKLGLDAIEKALAQEYRVLKTKNSNEVADIIFPHAKIAFLICHLKDIQLKTQGSMAVGTPSPVMVNLDNLKLFSESINIGYIMLIVNRESISKMLDLQNKFAEMFEVNKKNVQIIACADIGQVISGIMELARADQKESMIRKMKAEVHCVLTSPNDVGVGILKRCIPSLTTYQANVLLQGMGSLKACVLASSVQEILGKTPLDTRTAQVVYDFFAECSPDDE